MSAGLHVDDSNESPIGLKQLPVRNAGRDDSGNSSNSSSLEQLHHQPQPEQERELEQEQGETPTLDMRRQFDLNDKQRLWQSADVLLMKEGYDDDADSLHVPLHKTVCCALCR
jgi:hypothetical protein